MTSPCAARLNASWRHSVGGSATARLGLMLERQGIKLNAKKLYRLYKEERLTVRRRGGRKRALGTRAPMTIPQDRNLRWSLDFVADTLVSGRRFRILTLVDDFTRECLRPGGSDTSLTAPAWSPRELDRDRRTTASYPCMIRQRQRHRADLKRHPGRGNRSAVSNGTTSRRANQCRMASCESFNGRSARRVSQRTPVRQPQRRRDRSSKNGGSTTTPTDRIRASTG